jgi:hypothetical protein
MSSNPVSLPDRIIEAGEEIATRVVDVLPPGDPVCLVDAAANL